jgi:hypothetical protein
MDLILKAQKNKKNKKTQKKYSIIIDLYKYKSIIGD